MATQVYLTKRYLSGSRRNGQRAYRWALRWQSAEGWKCESTGTADRTSAEALQKAKWAELNIPGAAPPAPEPEPLPPASWQDCRDAFQRAMEADNLRPSYVGDAILTFDGLRALFPSIDSPQGVTADHANEYKRLRAESGLSPWSIRGDLATLKAIFGKWLRRECGLLQSNPFEAVKPPRCDDPDVRIVSAIESQDLLTWLANRWNNWRLPLVYLEVAALLGWRATEIASIREEDILPDGYVRVAAQTSKTRRQKFGWLPPELAAELKGCCAGGFAFGRFSDDLRRLLLLWKRRPHHAAKVKDFTPERLVGWVQDELQRFHESRQAAENEAAAKEGRKPDALETFTLHDYRRTAITGMQMAGVSEKEASVMVGATPEVIRRHYEKLDQMAIARKNVERRLGADGPAVIRMHQTLRAGCARPNTTPLDDSANRTQTVAG